MSRAHPQSLPVNRREITYYILFATVLVFVAGTVSAAIWMLRDAESRWVSIGSVDLYPPSDMPYPLNPPDPEDHRDGRIAGIWLVNIDGEITLFHRYETYSWNGNLCPAAWNGANMRFESPCWGSKYRIDGVLLDGPAKRDLDRYAFELRNGELFVDSLSLIPGTCREIPYEQLRGYYWEESGDPPVCEDA